MKDLEKKVLHHLRERGWDKLRPSDIAKSIMIEGAELLELFQWENRSLDEVRGDVEKIRNIERELADVLIYALEVAVLLGLNTKDIVNKKLAHIAEKYPAELMKKNAKKDSGSGTDSAYWRIKEEYRRKGIK